MSRLFRGLSIVWFCFWTFIFVNACSETMQKNPENEAGLVTGIALVMWMFVAVLPSAICWGAGRRMGADARRRTV